jgi:hypothetical protein
MLRGLAEATAALRRASWNDRADADAEDARSTPSGPVS